MFCHFFPRICLRGEVIFLHILVELYTRFTLLVPLRAVKNLFEIVIIRIVSIIIGCVQLFSIIAIIP